MKKNSGFTLIEVLIASALLLIFIYATFHFFSQVHRQNQMNNTVSSRDRIISGIRNVASMPAALRSSIRAAQADGVTPVNLALNNCVAGTTLNACQNDVESPLTLYSPTIAMDAAGNALGLLPITAPRNGAAPPMQFDTFGAPCSQTAPDCILNVYTSFKPQCPPQRLPNPPPDKTDPIYMSYVTPMTTCTIADVIYVNFWVELDPVFAANNPDLAATVSSVNGTVATSVKAIFGNDPR